MTDRRTDGPIDGRTDGPTKRVVESHSMRPKNAKWLSEKVEIKELKDPVKPKDGNKGGHPPKEYSLLG